MCGRYAIVTKVKAIEKRFELTAPKELQFEPNANVSSGNLAPVITDAQPNELQLFQFGFTPDWSKKQSYVINARSEGDFNRENNDQYKGQMGIVRKPMFRKSIRSRRCLVPSDCFIEGPEKEKLSRPYLIYLKDGQRPFSFAGIWDEWVNQSTGEIVKSFAIITTIANGVTKKIGHHRSPVILNPAHERLWISNDAPLDMMLDLLQPYPAELMNAYPISKEIKSPKTNGIKLLQPIGQRVNREYEYEIYDDIKLEGMGETNARSRKNSEGLQGTLF